MKTYVITLSKTFPTGHDREGAETYNKAKMLNGIREMHVPVTGGSYYVPGWQPHTKMHTIRTNYDLWYKRFEEINRGEACLSIREWSGRPYWSPQVEICRLTKEDGIGLQRILFYPTQTWKDLVPETSFRFGDKDNDHLVDLMSIANGDGLSFEDWKSWFKGTDMSKPLAIIQFTSYRY